MNKIKIIFSILAIPFGVFMFIYGGYDDSPGGQLLGLLAVIAGFMGIIKNKKKVIIFAVVIIGLVFLTYSAWQFFSREDNRDGKVFCTQEALICPSGSYVSRTGPNCEFSPCQGSLFTGALHKDTGNNFFLILPSPEGEPGEVEYVLPLMFGNNINPEQFLAKNIRVHGSFLEGANFSVDRIEELFGDAADPTLGEVAVGKSVFVNGVVITLNSVVGDSRCPVDVQCIQAGSVTANVTLRSDTDKKTTEISSAGPVVLFDSFKVSIENVKPQPRSNTKIGQEDYLITFRVRSTLTNQ